MKSIFNFIAAAGLTLFGTGCVIHHPQVAHHPPTPAPKPPPSHAPPVVMAPAPGRPAPAPPAASRPAKEPWVNVSITSGEQQVIREYVTSCAAEPDHKHQGRKGHKAKSLPPGLAKKAARGESLPPGWQKKVVKGEIMPVEVYRECDPLPQEVIVKLPPPPTGTILVTIEGKIVRLLQATREILDVFEIHG